METKYKYFIEDRETNEWYRNVPFHELTTRTDQHKPDPVYWTKDPHQALSFNTRKEAIDYLIIGLTYKNNGSDFMALTFYSFTKSWSIELRRDIPRDLIVTEHEFV